MCVCAREREDPSRQGESENQVGTTGRVRGARRVRTRPRTPVTGRVVPSATPESVVTPVSHESSTRLVTHRRDPSLPGW